MARPKPTHPGSAPRPSGWLRRLGGLAAWLLRSEDLPSDSARAPAPAGPGFLRWLFARETLPESEAGSPGPGTPVVRWLFAAERLPSPDPGESRGGSE